MSDMLSNQKKGGNDESTSGKKDKRDGQHMSLHVISNGV